MPQILSTGPGAWSINTKKFQIHCLEIFYIHQIIFLICFYFYFLQFLRWKKGAAGTSTEEQKQYIFYLAQNASIYEGRKVTFPSLAANLEPKRNTQ